MGFLRVDDVWGKSVLDLGCNLGAASFGAAGMGAERTWGLDRDPKLVAAAVALNAYFRAPSCFGVADLGLPCPDVPGPFDTVFCFSLFAHVGDTRALVETLRTQTGSVLYFEGHAGGVLGDYPFLGEEPFHGVELLGHMPDGSHTSRATRPLFRVARRRP